MKKSGLALIAVLFVLSISPVIAQSNDKSDDLKLESITTDMGRGILLNGYDIAATFSNKDIAFRIIGNQSRAYGRIQWKQIVPLTKVGVTIGYNKNAPWGGVQIVFEPVEFFSTLHWYGIVFGVPDNPAWKVNEFVNFHSATVKFWKLEASYSFMSLLSDKWNMYPEIKFTQGINKEWKFSVTAGYDINNACPLYQIGMKFSCL